MSVRLTDVLIDLANPHRLVAYLKHPAEFLATYSLDAAEIEALTRHESLPLRARAHSFGPGERRNAFVQFPRATSETPRLYSRWRLPKGR